MSGRFILFNFYSFCHLAYFILKFFLSKFCTSISWPKNRWRSYICIPSWAKTHKIAHTKEEPPARLNNSFFVQKKTNIFILSKASQSLIRSNIRSLP